MQLIECESHFWELYQHNHQYFMSIAVDMSSVVSCWDLILSDVEINNYKMLGREAIQTLAKQIIDAAYKGDFSLMDSRLASEENSSMMQLTYQHWKLQHN